MDHGKPVFSSRVLSGLYIAVLKLAQLAAGEHLAHTVGKWKLCCSNTQLLPASVVASAFDPKMLQCIQRLAA